LALQRGRFLAITNAPVPRQTTDFAFSWKTKRAGEVPARVPEYLTAASISSLLALPVAERDDAGIAAMRKDIEKMRAEQRSAPSSTNVFPNILT
jgi:hypothetical protein